MVTTVVEQLSPTRVKLAISVPPEELKPGITKAYGTIASQVSIPGFRKGKVPAPIIDQRVGRGAVLEQAVNDGLDGFFRTAVEEQGIRPLGRPSADIAAWPDAKDFSGDLQLVVEVDVRPEITLPSLDDLTLEVAAAEVSDADVDAELDTLRGRFGTLVTVDRPAKSGDFTQLDLVARIGEEEVDTASSISYEIGSGELIAGIDEALDSLTAGETTTFESVLLGGDHEGETAQITVSLVSVKERELPDVDEDFAQMASEFDTVAELRADLAQQAARRHTFDQVQEAREKLVTTLLERVDVPVPASLIEDEVHRHLENESRLEDAEHRAEVTESSEKAFRQQLLFDAIAEQEQIQVSQDELTQYLIQGAQQYNMQPQEFVEVLQQNGQIPSMVGEVARSKAIAVLLGRATVVDTAGNAVDISDFVAAPEDAAADDSAADDSAEDDSAADETATADETAEQAKA